MTHTTSHAEMLNQRLSGESGGLAASLHEVSFGYQPGRAVVCDVSTELSDGRVCALIGPNAAGKSTLLKLMLGQLSPWSGRVEVADEPVEQMPFDRRATLVSYVPQQGGVSFAFTVRQVVAMGRYAMGDGGEHVDRAIAQCDLAGLEGRVYSELSGGQQQRVLLARAVAQAAGCGRLMLLDEPASGMDLRHIHQTMKMLKQIAQGEDGRPGPAVLIVLHDVNLAARYADDVWLMDRGGLVAAGPCREVMRPELLGRVYGVGFKAMTPPADGTQTEPAPVFWIDPPDTIG